LQKTPEEWQAINKKAMNDFHASMAADPTKPNRDALEAIKDSNDALNEYDKPAITAGNNVSGPEAGAAEGMGKPSAVFGGLAEGALNAAISPAHLIMTLYRQGGRAATDEIGQGLKNIPADLSSGDPERIASQFGGAAAGIAMGKLGTKLARASGGAISNLLERPGLKNALLRAQISAAENSVAKGGGTLSDALEQSKLKTDTMRQNIEHKTQLQPDRVEQAGLKTNQMHQNVAEKAGTLHEDVQTPGLKNQQLRLQIEALQKQLDDLGDDDANPSGSAPVDPTKPPATPPNILGNTPTDVPGGTPKVPPTSASDPYGLDALSKATPPADQLGKFINNLKATEAETESLSNEDVLKGQYEPRPTKSNLPPLTQEQINQLLRDIGGGNMSK
jgi:hypothetical protein